jgi:hypothetical protein
MFVEGQFPHNGFTREVKVNKGSVSLMFFTHMIANII